MHWSAVSAESRVVGRSYAMQACPHLRISALLIWSTLFMLVCSPCPLLSPLSYFSPAAVIVVIEHVDHI